jgi:5-methylcytosine-specific restriction endonuclease McrA
VIDRFHNVNGGEIAERFFIKEQGGIRVTENLFKLFADTESHNLLYETEARWRLVETAWDLNLSRNLITIQTDNDGIELFTNNNGRRVDVTSSRGALNGYQKGKCFYCYDRISIISGDDTLADVDHFLPHTLIKTGDNYNVNGVWNLVLACQDCNRGSDGKFAKVPTSKLLKRLHKRNEYLITSHHPLRETLISQTGKTENHRKQYIQGCYDNAIRHLIHTWEPTPKDSETF